MLDLSKSLMLDGRGSLCQLGLATLISLPASGDLGFGEFFLDVLQGADCVLPRCAVSGQDQGAWALALRT